MKYLQSKGVFSYPVKLRVWPSFSEGHSICFYSITAVSYKGTKETGLQNNHKTPTSQGQHAQPEEESRVHAFSTLYYYLTLRNNEMSIKMASFICYEHAYMCMYLCIHHACLCILRYFIMLLVIDIVLNEHIRIVDYPKITTRWLLTVFIFFSKFPC